MTNGVLLGKLPTFSAKASPVYLHLCTRQVEVVRGQGLLFLGQCLNGRFLE